MESFRFLYETVLKKPPRKLHLGRTEGRTDRLITIGHLPYGEALICAQIFQKDEDNSLQFSTSTAMQTFQKYISLA
jgi:hypothetical protein